MAVGCGIDAGPSCRWVSADHGGLGSWPAVMAGVLLLARRCCQRAWELGLGVRLQGELEAGAVSGCPPPHPQSSQPPRLLQLGILSQQLGQEAHWTLLPLWWAGRDLAPHRVRSDRGLAHLWGGSGSQAPLLAPRCIWDLLAAHPHPSLLHGKDQRDGKVEDAPGGTRDYRNIWGPGWSRGFAYVFHTWGPLE